MFRVQISAIAMDEPNDGMGGTPTPYIVDAPTIVAPMTAEAMTVEAMTVAHINPVTGLATDYLNHFNEAIMLLEMLRACPDCRDDLRAWKPMSYCEHFRQSRFTGRERAIAAYEATDPAIRDTLDAVTGTMTALVEHARKEIDAEPNAKISAGIAERAAAWLKLLAAQAGSVINGHRIASADGAPQSAVDRMIG